MKIVAKTMGKVVLEVTTREIEELGFDFLWDRTRGVYSAEDYDVHSIGSHNKNDKIIYIELVAKKLRD